MGAEEREIAARVSMADGQPLIGAVMADARRAFKLRLELPAPRCCATADMLGLPYAPPNPDPIVMDLKSGEVSKEQPYIGWLTRLGVAAAERGRGLQLLKEVSAVIFGGTRDWHLGDHVARAVARSGVDLTELHRAIDANAERYEATIAGNEAAQKGAGHWGVPLMVFEGEPFFGQDRFETLKWRMTQNGLQRRS